MKFADVIGLDEIKQKLISSVHNGRISHAMMFISAEGTGGLPLALAYAQYLNCINRQENDSCGTCPSCHKIERLIHPDIHFSFPVIKKNDHPVSDDFINEWRSALMENPYMGYFDWLGKMDAENKQGNIAVSECHAIIKKLSYKTFEGTYKIMIMWLPEYLGKNGNTLLKIIEEPPDQTIFLFIAYNKNLILNTILSRTQQILLPPLQSSSISNRLIDTFNLEKEEAGKIAELSAGNYSEALRIYQSGKNDHSEEFIKWMRLCWANNAVEIYKWVIEFAPKGREYQKDFLLYGIRMIRETILLKNETSSLSHLNKDEMVFGKDFSLFMNTDVAYQIYEQLDKSYYYIERNANPRILFFNLSLQLNKILRNLA